MPTLELTDQEAEVIRRRRLTPEARQAEDRARAESRQAEVIARLSPTARAVYDAKIAELAARTPEECMAANIIARQKFLEREKAKIDKVLVDNPAVADLVIDLKPKKE